MAIERGGYPPIRTFTNLAGERHAAARRVQRDVVVLRRIGSADAPESFRRDIIDRIGGFERVSVLGNDGVIHQMQRTIDHDRAMNVLHLLPDIEETAGMLLAESQARLADTEDLLVDLAPDYLKLRPTLPRGSELAKLRASRSARVSEEVLADWKMFDALPREVPSFAAELDRLRAEKEVALLTINRQTGTATIEGQDAVTGLGDINLRLLSILAASPGEPITKRMLIEESDQGGKAVLRQRGEFDKRITRLSEEFGAIEMVETIDGPGYQLNATTVNYTDREGNAWQSHAYRDAIPPEERISGFIRVGEPPEAEPEEKPRELPILHIHPDGTFTTMDQDTPRSTANFGANIFAMLAHLLAKNAGRIVSQSDLIAVSPDVLAEPGTVEKRVEYINNQLGGIIVSEIIDGEQGYKLDATVVELDPPAEVVLRPDEPVILTKPHTIEPETPEYGLLTKTDMATIAAAMLAVPVQETFLETIPTLETYVDEATLEELSTYADLSNVSNVSFRALPALIRAQTMINDPSLDLDASLLELTETAEAPAELILFLAELDQFGETNNPDYTGIQYLADILRDPDKRTESLTFIRNPQPETDAEPSRDLEPARTRTRKRQGRTTLLEREIPKIRTAIQNAFTMIGQTLLPEEPTIDDIVSLFPDLPPRKLRSLINNLGNAGYISPNFQNGKPDEWRFADNDIATVAILIPHFDIETTDKNLRSENLTRKMLKQAAGLVKEEYGLHGIQIIAQERARIAQETNS